METLKIQIVENIKIVDALYLNREIKIRNDILSHFFSYDWLVIKTIFNGVVAFARPPTTILKILIFLNKPLG